MFQVRKMVLTALLAMSLASCVGGSADTTTTSTIDETTTTEAVTTTMAETTTTTHAATTTTEPNPFTEALAGTRYGRPDVPNHGGNEFMFVVGSNGGATFGIPGGTYTWVGQVRETTADSVTLFFQMRDMILWNCDDGDDLATYGYALSGGTLQFIDQGDECEQRRDFLTTTAWSER